MYSIEDVTIEAGRIGKIKTGVSIDLPPGTVGIIKDRSSMGSKGMHVFAGVIDCGYIGEISVILYNSGKPSETWPYVVKKGDKIAQLVIMPIEVVEWEQVQELSSTERGSSGFGSSGK